MTPLQEKLIIQSIWLERYKGETPKIIIERLKKASKKINAAVNKNLPFPQLEKIVAEQMKYVYLEYDILLYNDMEKISETAYNATNNLVNAIAVANSFPEAPKFVDLSKEAQKRILNVNRPVLGQTLKTLKANAIFKGADRIREALRKGLNEDLSLSKTQRNVRAIELKDEVIGSLSRHQLDSNTSTMLKSAIEEARGEVYNQHKDIIKGWRSLGTLDNRTSDICVSLDNVFYSSEKYTWETVPYKPPRHYNCRSMLLPETEFDELDSLERPLTLYEGKTVNHRDGTTSTKWIVKNSKLVDGKKSFNQLFGEQSEEFQKAYLGKKRYELYKKDNSLLKKQYNLRRNEVLTIEELQSKLNLN